MFVINDDDDADCDYISCNDYSNHHKQEILLMMLLPWLMKHTQVTIFWYFRCPELAGSQPISSSADPSAPLPSMSMDDAIAEEGSEENDHGTASSQSSSSNATQVLFHSLAKLQERYCKFLFHVGILKKYTEHQKKHHFFRATLTKIHCIKLIIFRHR